MGFVVVHDDLEIGVECVLVSSKSRGELQDDKVELVRRNRALNWPCPEGYLLLLQVSQFVTIGINIANINWG